MITKKNIIIAAILIVLLGGGVLWAKSAKRIKGWTPADFRFYDESGNVVLEPTMELPYVAEIDTSKSYLTYRGVKIGDDAISALKNYNLDGMSITVFKGEENIADKTITKDYREKIKDFDDIVKYLPEMTEKGYVLKITINTYKQDGKLIVKNQLKNRDERQVYQKLKYIIAFEIQDSKIVSISFDNNYLRELSRCYEENNHMVPEDASYDWLRELGADENVE